MGIWGEWEPCGATKPRQGSVLLLSTPGRAGRNEAWIIRPPLTQATCGRAFMGRAFYLVSGVGTLPVLHAPFQKIFIAMYLATDKPPRYERQIGTYPSCTATRSPLY